MRFRNWLRITLLPAVLSVMLSPVAAQEPGPGPGDPELRERLFEYFEKRLRIALALTDDQAAEVLPKVKSMERERVTAMRDRREASMELRRAYQEGAPDAELERLLLQIEEVEERQRLRTKELLSEIDGSLSVRQRVQFRTFLDRFRQEIRRRMQEFRGAGRRGQHRGPEGPGMHRPAPNRR